MRPPGHALFEIACRVCSRRVVESLVIPALADVQHEYRAVAGRGRWARVHVLARGYAGLLAALLMDLGALPSRHLRENWIGKEAPGRQLLRPVAPRAGAVLVAFTAFVLIDSVTRRPWRLYYDHSPFVFWELAVTLLPSILALAVPISLLLGLVMGLRRLSAGPVFAGRWMAPATGLSMAVAAGLFVLCGWIVPVANHSFRENVYRLLVRSPEVCLKAEGHRELTLGELTARIVEARRAGTAATKLRVEWHKKLVTPLFCAFLGPLAVGLVASGRGRAPSGGRSLAFAVLLFGAFFVASALGEMAATKGQVEPVIGVWAAVVIPALGALSALVRRRDEAQHWFRDQYET